MDRPGGSVAVVSGGEAVWVRLHSGTSHRGSHDFQCRDELISDRPDTDDLTLIVAWPPDMCSRGAMTAGSRGAMSVGSRLLL